MNDKKKRKKKLKMDLDDWRSQIYQQMGARRNKCRICGTSRGVLHKYGLNICYKCFKEVHEDLGFRKSSVHRS